MTKLDIYETVTNKIVSELEEGALPWVKEWTCGGGMPVNAITGRQYSGINTLILWIMAEQKSFSSNKWCTFNQAKTKKSSVIKGEKSTAVIFYKQLEKESTNDKGDIEYISIPMLKRFNVFNVDQIDGIEDGKTNENIEALPEIELFIQSLDVKMVIGSPAFIPKMDWLHMPKIDSFSSVDGYYATLFHELIHWSGAKKRLDRDMQGRFGDESYAMEELIAEIGAAFLCAEFGFKSEVRHAGYIESWLKVLKNDKKAIFAAAAKASQAVEYIKSIAVGKIHSTD